MLSFLAINLLISLLINLALAPWTLGTAQAQQAAEVTDHLEIGPYQITVVGGASGIALGSAQYAVTLRSAAAGQPVTNAQVLLRTHHPVDGISGWATALNTPEAPGVYRARLELDRPGQWEVNVEVSSPLGQVAAEITPLVIPQAKQYGSGSLVFVGVTVVLLSGLGYVLWSIHRVQRQRASRQSNVAQATGATGTTGVNNES